MILGIECTAHTFGVSICKNGKVLSNIKDMYRPETGGIIPNKSAEHHRKVSEIIYQEALKQAKVTEDQINAIALSNAPGLAPCLIAGKNFAQEKAKKLGLKIIPVNHCIAHLEIGQSIGAKDPVLLYASGANTQIIAYSIGRYRVFGETLDIGIGNLIDKFARFTGTGFPGGPKIEKEALIGAEKGKYLELPYVVKGMDVSFSGIQTKLQQFYTKGEEISTLSFSLQETAFAMLVESAERAMAHTEKKELVLGGGVACNQRLQEMCKIMCKERGAKFFCPGKEFLTDNAGMIAFTGELMFKSNKNCALNPEQIDFDDRQRTDDIEVFWK